MKNRSLWPAIAIALLFACHTFAADAPNVESFAPQGTAKNVRQVKARFSEAMVSFGDPQVAAPFDVDCAEPGSGLWVDERTWVYDFERDLPGGVECTFRLKLGARTLKGTAVGGAQQFTFSTGGPAIIDSRPGSDGTISEDQVFLLALDTPATAASIVHNTFCETPGSSERIGVRLITGDQRRTILDTQRYFLERYLRRTSGEHDSGSAAWKKKMQALRDGAHSPIVMLQCRLRFPEEAPVRLVWGRGVASLSGIATGKDQVLSFTTRQAFRATFTCNRVNKDAQCNPVLPMSLNFTAPVARATAQQIRLEAAGGKTYAPKFDDEKQDYVQRVRFPAPFPENTGFKVIVPQHIQDDSGRALANAGSFPLAVQTDENPPLAKFAADFGIIELNAGALLPVTLRNLEPAVKAELLTLNPSAAKPASTADAPIPGRVLAVGSNYATYATDIVSWLKRLREARQNVWENIKGKGRVLKSPRGSRSVFSAKDQPRRFDLPVAENGKAFEVVGIPLMKAGFYVVELASPRLGASLFGKRKPYYVQSAALVTNLSAHLKLGRESSLVWVTALDSGQPVAGAAVDVLDCGGKSYWHGKTDEHGIARIDRALPELAALPGCLEEYDRQYVVTARAGDDMTFLLSNWNEGIQPWRFNLPQGSYYGPYIATAVFDRTLLRAGETVHMKLFARKHTDTGFAFVARRDLQGKAVIVHQGSGERYEVPVAWDDQGRASAEWAIPKDAKQGEYQVEVIDRIGLGPENKQSNQRAAGTFRVESFRVPTMKAIVKPADGPLINAHSATVDVQLNYLSGGGASFAPVALRSLITPRSVSFPDYEGFVFANGNVTAGIARSGGGEQDKEAAAQTSKPLATQTLKLDQAGAGRFTIGDLPQADQPRTLLAEFEYHDANGETRTAATRIGLWTAGIVLGIKPDDWAVSKDQFKFQVAALDLNGKPQPGVAVNVDLFQREEYSHRKRLIGGFYAYENVTEVKRVGALCDGTTDARGLLLCDAKSPVSGNVVLRAQAKDGAGNAAYANRDVWVAGSGDWWFDMSDSDRMDLLPEKKRYEPGDTATFQVRMPFREATALVTVEREGVIDSFVTHLSGKAPVVKVPIKGGYAPNVFVSVLAVRGRVNDVQPTAVIDLGKPAFKLGIAEINVGWRAHELKVDVATDRTMYKVRDKAQVTVSVKRADGSALPAGTEVALAAVDEGLLELWPNKSWNLLDTMMQRRSLEVETATAQMQVVGKRHFGRKALPAGGGGGRLPARELFDTLLYWNARVALDAAGTAKVTVPLNDSLTSFRIVAIADAGADHFGTGKTTIRSTQDVMLLSGLPQLVRQGDRYHAGFTVRNASDATFALGVGAAVVEISGGKRTLHQPDLEPRAVVLKPGEAREVGWDFPAPARANALEWFAAVVAKTSAGATAGSDLIHVTQKVIPAVPVRTLQASIVQLDQPVDLQVQRPAGALPGRGGVRVGLSPRLASSLSGVDDYMSAYPYTCFEQQTSKAVALRDLGAWQHLMARLPGYLDADGLVKFFPDMTSGSDALTAYVLAISGATGWKLPQAPKARMVAALRAFVQGKITRHSEVRAADLALRKIAALSALARSDPKLDPRLLDSIAIQPNLWPTSTLLDWIDLLRRAARIPDRTKRLADAENIIRSRLDLRGTMLRFSTERSDFLWWLMVSGDVNANRAILTFLDNPRWRSDMPRMVRGALERQRHGHWDTTVANAWGVVALEKFSEKFESVPVTGTTRAKLADQSHAFDWQAQPDGGSFDLGWPQPGTGTLAIAHHGSGKPWVTVQSRAAVPLKAPLASGFRITRSVTPVTQKVQGTWSRGDVARVKLEIDAQAGMSWVVVRDPVPAGATILGSGLGGDSRILTQGEGRVSDLWPAFEERTADSYRAYYSYVPKGKWTAEYTVRLNNAGRFELPPTRVEALYAPETFGETPNAAMTVER